MNTIVRLEEVSLTAQELTEYGSWKKLGWRSSLLRHRRKE
jgi:hypothetical protein